MNNNKIMKHRLFPVFLAITLVFSTFGIMSVAAQNRDYTALYRLYDSQNRDHLYTTGCTEKDNLLRSGGWVYEKVAGYVANRQMRNTTPLYRLHLTSGEHFYTTSSQEVTNLVNARNKSEGVTGYVSERRARNTLPFYRLANSERHLYTTDEDEKNRFIQTTGAQSEDLPGYVWTSGENPCDWSNPPDPNSFPVIYAGTNFDNAAEAIERNKTELKDWDGSPHTIRSIRVPQGWYLVLYSKSKFRGKSYNLNSNITFAPGDEWYNKIRSIKVYKGTPPKQPR